MARIKDINGDGKRNFKDTWLGEKLLGGGKTKGPNMKESMAGARREASAAPIRSTKPVAKAAAKPTVDKRPAAKPTVDKRPAAKPTVDKRPAAKPTVDKRPVTKDAMTGYRKGDVTTSALPKVETKPSGPMPSRNMSPTRSETATGRYSEYEIARLGNITEAQWDKLTPAQREAKGLPVTWVDYVRSGGDSVVKKAPATIAQAGKVGRYAKGGYAKGGYAKGGMVKNKKGKC